MTRKILLLASLCVTGIVSAQVQNKIGIGMGISIPDPSAMLHVESTNKGLLIPNVELTDLTSKAPITSDIKESLLVYNKKAGALSKGYYYWLKTNNNPEGKWVRVLTSEDSSEILEGQIQESLVEITKEVDGKKESTGVFVYNPDKTKVDDLTAEGRIIIDIPSLVNKNQTLTSFGLKQYELFHYLNGRIVREKLPAEEAEDIGNVLVKTTKELELVYIDEKGEEHKFSVKDLLGASNEDVPAITSLRVSSGVDGLEYTNDKGIPLEIGLSEVVKKLETPTTLSVDENDNLVFTNERNIKQQVSLRSVVREPWRVAEDNIEAVNNNQNIFTQGWIGVGLKPNEAKIAIADLKPDEKLRVNGSIYARNSYYADYVFENYFSKQASSLKYDYKFNDLSTVESYIKSNYHLPGITPISELDKSIDQGYLINISELSIQLLEKVEELYLHTIEQQKLIQVQQNQLEQQESRLRQLETYLKISK